VGILWVAIPLRDFANCEIMDPMTSELRSKVWDALWEDIGPDIVSWLGDLVRASMMWMGIFVLHLIQLVVLRFGWSPFFVHWLDIAEECAVFATVMTFFLFSTVRFFWAARQHTVRGMK
jgi:hypothetical protein